METIEDAFANADFTQVWAKLYKNHTDKGEGAKGRLMRGDHSDPEDTTNFQNVQRAVKSMIAKREKEIEKTAKKLAADAAEAAEKSRTASRQTARDTPAQGIGGRLPGSAPQVDWSTVIERLATSIFVQDVQGQPGCSRPLAPPTVSEGPARGGHQSAEEDYDFEAWARKWRTILGKDSIPDGMGAAYILQVVEPKVGIEPPEEADFYKNLVPRCKQVNAKSLG